MTKVFVLLAATLGGWIGWIAGAQLSFFTAFLVSVIGTATGVYIARRFARNYS